MVDLSSRYTLEAQMLGAQAFMVFNAYTQQTTFLYSLFTDRLLSRKTKAFEYLFGTVGVSNLQVGIGRGIIYRPSSFLLNFLFALAKPSSQYCNVKNESSTNCSLGGSVSALGQNSPLRAGMKPTDKGSGCGTQAHCLLACFVAPWCAILVHSTPMAAHHFTSLTSRKLKWRSFLLSAAGVWITWYNAPVCTPRTTSTPYFMLLGILIVRAHLFLPRSALTVSRESVFRQPACDGTSSSKSDSWNTGFALLLRKNAKLCPMPMPMRRVRAQP